MKNASRDYDEEGMALFEESVKKYMPADEDFDGLVKDEEIHDLSFLRKLTKLRVLELGEIQLSTLEGTERILDREELCIWPTFYCYD